jgi:hypothetical protein
MNQNNNQTLVESLTYTKDGKQYINMENYALDFSVPYEYKGFTKSGNVRLVRNNGNSETNKIGKISNGNLHTEGHRYSIRLE